MSSFTLPLVHPLVFLPFHLASHHLTARMFSAKSITYPLHLAFTLTQYSIEHFTSSLPKSVTALNGPLVGVAVLMIPAVYYCAIKKTTGPKSLVWASLASMFVVLLVFQGLELGFPKDDPADQIIANVNVVHSWWHLLIHILLLTISTMASYHVPWSSVKEEMEMVPASPAHKTLSPMKSTAKKWSSLGEASDCSVVPTKVAWAKPKLN